MSYISRLPPSVPHFPHPGPKWAGGGAKIALSLWKATQTPAPTQSPWLLGCLTRAARLVQVAIRVSAMMAETHLFLGKLVTLLIHFPSARQEELGQSKRSVLGKGWNFPSPERASPAPRGVISLLYSSIHSSQSSPLALTWHLTVLPVVRAFSSTHRLLFIHSDERFTNFSASESPGRPVGKRRGPGPVLPQLLSQWVWWGQGRSEPAV